MTSVAPAAGIERYDVRTIVGSGVKLGVVTALGVTVFALISRPLASGAVETVVQSLMVLAGGAVFAYLPAHWVRPRSADGIAWAALVGLLGALAFTVFDTAILRSVHLYHWTWDQIGGGSGFWYIPVWWMGAAFLAWLGGWVTAVSARRGGPASVVPTAIQTCGLAAILFALLTAVRVAPFHTAIMALALGLALVLHLPIASALTRR